MAPVTRVRFPAAAFLILKAVYFTIKRLRVLLTQDCNLKCKWCCKEGQFSKRKQLSANDFLDAIYFIARFGLQEVKFSGGEPLLYEQLPYIIGEVKKIKKIKTSITTNGIRLKEKLKELENSRVDEVSVTVNTFNPQLFKALCNGSEEKLKRIMKGVKALSNSRIPKKCISFVLTTKNLNEIPSLLGFAQKCKVGVRFIRLIREKKYYVSPQSFFNYLKSVFPKLEIPNPESKSYSNFKINQVSCCFVNSACGENPSCERCNASFFMRLTTDGKLKPCLASEKGEVDLITYLRNARKTVENVIMEKAKWRLK